jgi:hypothetical protein
VKPPGLQCPVCLALLCAVCLVGSGCGAQIVSTTVTRTTRAPAPPRSTGRATSQARRQTRTPASSHGFSGQAAEVVIAFADAYINWSARTVSADMQTLATESIGQAHSAMELAAGETARDYELQQGGIANSGQIEAVGPLTGSHDQWVVVTRESTTATASNAYQGLQPAWHVIVATAVELSSGRWVVSQWQPEN